MLSKKHTSEKSATFSWISNLARRDPLTISRWVLLWVIVGVVCGLFAACYWLVLEWITRKLEIFTGPSLLILMPLAGLFVGLVIHFLGNPGEIALIVDNIHSRGGRLDTRENSSMILASLASISAGGSAGPEAPLVQVTGYFGTWIASQLKLQGEDLRSLSLAAMAAGFTALFGAPLGGAFFAIEILHHQLSTTLLMAKLTGFSSFTPILFASLVGFFLAPKLPFITSQLKLKQGALSD